MVLLAACGKSAPPPAVQPAPDAAPTAAPAAQAPPLPVDLAARLDWLPADTALLGRQEPPGALLIWLQQFKGPVPTCVPELAERIDAVYGFARQMGERQVVGYHFVGGPPRQRIETCAGPTSAFLEGIVGTRITMKQDGAFTHFTTREGGTEVLGFTDDNWVLEGDRARLEEVMARKTHLSENPKLVALLPRVQTVGGPWWMVGTGDMTGKLLGVPSAGIVLRTFGQKESTQVPIALLYASPDEAKRAAAALAKESQDPKLPQVVRDVLAQFGAHVEGSELVLDVAPVFKSKDPTLLPELQKLMQTQATTR
jgi:hypothetical protein